MSQNILTTNTVCVETIHSDSDLEIFSNRKISFDTPNMLVNELHFNKHIDNVVFGTTPPLTDTSYEYKVTTISQNEIDISQMGEYDLEMVDCLEVSSSQTFQDVSGTNKEHYVNLSASNNLIIRSENIFVKNEPFDDYVYRLVNNKNDPNPNTETTPSISIVPADRFNVTNFGAYFTNKINCNKISTENIYIDSSGSNEEPVLNINSRSAVNLQSLNILIDDSNTGSTVDLDTYLKSRLDESGMFTITIIPESGVDIGFTYDQSSVGKGFSNNYNSITAFNYIINFKIVPTGQTPTDGASTNVLDEVLTPAASDAQTYITYSNTPLTTYSLTNLNAGEFYDIYADVTNNFTNTTVYNVLTNGINIPTIEHVVINSITVIDEKQIEIRFIPHATQIANWNTYEKKVRFFVRLDNVNSVVNNDLLPDTSGFIEVDLSTASRSEQTYILDVTQYSSYPSANHIIVGSGFETNLHSFSIVSQHTSYPTSAFEMITPTPQSLTPFTFSAPSQPSNLQLDLDGENLFTWTQSSNTPTTTKITKIFYDIFRNGGSRLNSSDLENVGVCNSYTNVLQNIGLDLNTYRNVQQGIIPGTYQIQSYNLFGQRSGFATKQINTLSVGAPSFSTPTSANRSWRVSYSVNGANGSYYVSSNKGSATNSTYFHTTLDVGTHNVYVQVEDTAMRIRTNNSASITINQPVITIEDGSYVTGSTRQFSFPISLTSSSYSGASISSVSNAFSVTNCSAVSSNSAVSSTNYIIVQVNNSSTSINISFSTNAVDTYGYTSATASKTNLPISVSFDSVSTPSVEYQSTRTFGLSSSSDFSGFQWKLNGTDIGGQTGTTVTLADNEQYFGTISCSFTIVNNQGFSKTESSSINNTEPTIISGSFTITSSSAYNHSYSVGPFVYSSYTELSRRVMKSGSVETSYSSSGTYTLQVQLQNSYGFSKWLTVASQTIGNPVAASFEFSDRTKTSISIGNIVYGDDGGFGFGDIRIYWSIQNSQYSSNPDPMYNGSASILSTRPTSYQVYGLRPGSNYYFHITKSYVTPYVNSVTTPTIYDYSTLSLVPPISPTITSVTLTTTDVSISWNSNNNNDATEVSYSIEIHSRDYDPVAFSIYDLPTNTTSFSLPTETIPIKIVDSYYGAASVGFDAGFIIGYNYEIRVRKIAVNPVITTLHSLFDEVTEVFTFDSSQPIFSPKVNIKIVRLDGTYVSDVFATHDAFFTTKAPSTNEYNFSSRYNANLRNSTDTNNFFIRRYPIDGSSAPKYVIFAEIHVHSNGVGYYYIVQSYGSRLSTAGHLQSSSTYDVIDHDWSFSSSDNSQYLVPSSYPWIQNWESIDTDYYLLNSGYSYTSRFLHFKVESVTSVTTAGRTYNKVHLLKFARISHDEWFNTKFVDYGSSQYDAPYASYELTNDAPEFGFVFVNESNQEIFL